MKYIIAFEADKHWGCMRADEQYRSSYVLKKFLAEFPIDLYVNLGDFFDTKLLLNSRSSVYAVKDMNEKVAICRARGIPVRAIKGTRSHDYDQWEIFNNLLSDPKNQFKYFRECTIEETLPGLNVLYCPEENMNFTRYLNKYADKILEKKINIGCLHGSFDKVLPAVALDRYNSDISTTLVYQYEDMSTAVRGPLIAGHWHDGMVNEHMIYVGSYDRWTFGEDEIKGFGLVEYDTDTENYKYIKVPNPYASTYKTYAVYTSIYQTVEAYTALIEAVHASLNSNPKMHVRILIRINELQSDTEQQIENLKFEFANIHRVHFTIINQIAKKAYEKQVEENKTMSTNYAFVKDKSLTLAEKINQCIENLYGRKYKSDEIDSIINPYLKNR